MMSFSRWFAVALPFAALGCTLDMEDAPCPCDEARYHCCTTINRCVQNGEACPSDGGSTGQGGAPARGGSNASGGETNGGKSNSGGKGSAGSGQGNAPSSGGASASGGAPASGGSAQTGGLGTGGVPAVGTGGTSNGGAAAGEGGAGGEPPGVAGAPSAFTLVATQHNDDSRTGANLNETVLNTTTVTPASFGQVSRRPLRGAVFAQPLVVPGVNIQNKGKFDVLLVATMSNTVYALDARQPEQPPLWSQTAAPSILVPDPAVPFGAENVWHEVGIWGTPVVSIGEGAVYVVVATKISGAYQHQIQKLDLRSGLLLERKEISAPGFDSALQAQIGGLAISGGVVYVPFASYLPNGGSGWIFAYDLGLSPLGAVKLGNPDGGTVSMSGQAPAADGTGSIYFTTNPSPMSSEHPLPVTGSRLLKLRNPAAAELSELLFPVAASTTGTNELGNGGVLQIPNSDRMVAVGQHRIYVVSRAGELVQQFRPSVSGACDQTMFSCNTKPMPAAFWPGSGTSPRPRLFAWSATDQLRSFGFDATGGRFDCTSSDDTCTALASAAARDSYDSANMPLEGAAQLSVSSNGTTAGSGIVWAAHAYSRDNTRNPDGILRAFDAESLEQLWSSQNARVPLGPLGPGAVPTVSGGKVFMGTADGISNKQTFWDDPIAGPPAITSFGDKYLVIAWGRISTVNRGFQLKWSSDGVKFDTSAVYDNFLYYEPALASDGDKRLFLGWTASTQTVKVAVSGSPDFVQSKFMQQRELGGALSTLSLPATTAPALVYGGGRLFLSWNYEQTVHVISSSDGVAFDESTHVTIPDQFSYQPPLLAYLDAKLYLITSDVGRRLNLYVSIDGGTHFGAPTPLPMPSAGHPALCVSSRDNSNDREFQLIWTQAPMDGPSQGFINAASAPRWDFQGFVRAHDFNVEQADFSISGTRFRDSCYIAWMGVGENAQRPNIARYSPGELVTYGVGGN